MQGSDCPLKGSSESTEEEMQIMQLLESTSVLDLDSTRYGDKNEEEIVEQSRRKKRDTLRNKVYSGKKN